MLRLGILIALCFGMGWPTMTHGQMNSCDGFISKLEQRFSEIHGHAISPASIEFVDPLIVRLDMLNPLLWEQKKLTFQQRLLQERSRRNNEQIEQLQKHLEEIEVWTRQAVASNADELQNRESMKRDMLQQLAMAEMEIAEIRSAMAIAKNDPAVKMDIRQQELEMQMQREKIALREKELDQAQKLAAKAFVPQSEVEKLQTELNIARVELENLEIMRQKMDLVPEHRLSEALERAVTRASGLRDRAASLEQEAEELVAVRQKLDEKEKLSGQLAVIQTRQSTLDEKIDELDFSLSYLQFLIDEYEQALAQVEAKRPKSDSDR